MYLRNSLLNVNYNFICLSESWLNMIQCYTIIGGASGYVEGMQSHILKLGW